jgi:hypothetical protein
MTQVTSNKLQAPSSRLQAPGCDVSRIALPGPNAIMYSNKSNGALASVSMRDLLIPLVDRPSHKSDSVRPTRGSFSFFKIKVPSTRLKDF